MIDVTAFMDRCSMIYDFYELAKYGLEHPHTSREKVDKTIGLMKSVLKDPEGGKYFVDGKVPSKEFWETKSLISAVEHQVREKIEFASNVLKKQTVVLYHSYIEIIMGSIVRMILEKNAAVLKRIYMDKDEFPFRAKEIIDNKDTVINLLVEKEVERFIRLSIERKRKYYKKYFNIDFNWTDDNFKIDIGEIDSLRHDIIHTERQIIIDEYKLLLINNYIVGFGMNLLFQSRQKFKIDIVWTDGQGRNFLK